MQIATHTQRLTFTVEDLPRLYEAGIIDADARIELINGEIYFMSPINYPHAHCVNVLTNLFASQLNEQFFVAVQNPVMLNAQNLPEPDLAIYEREALLNRKQHPTPDITHLIIEVSDTTYTKDKEQKLPLYAAAGVPVVWIVNINKRTVEVYQNPVHHEYAQHEYASLNIFYEQQAVPTTFGFTLDTQTMFLSKEQ